MPQCAAFAGFGAYRMRNNPFPIGILDSGVGGLSVFKELFKEFPLESFVYFADSAYCPYGSKTKEELEKRIKLIVSMFLDEYACKMIVFACNTATAAAIDTIRTAYPSIPFIGMEPAVKTAALHSHTNAVGILATEGTLKGKLFLQTTDRFAAKTHLVVRVGTGLVELVEAGMEQSEQANALLQEYLAPMVQENVDHIVLGCTHYPFLTDQIRKIVGDTMEILNPAPAVAKHAKEVLSQRNELTTDTENAPSYTWLTSGDPLKFERFYSIQMQKGELPALPLSVVHKEL